jgi:hypothetical protein
MRSGTFIIVSMLAVSSVSICLASAQRPSGGTPAPTLSQSIQNPEKQSQDHQEAFDVILQDATRELQSGDVDRSITDVDRILRPGSDAPASMRAKAAAVLVEALNKKTQPVYLKISDFLKAFPPLGPLIVVAFVLTAVCCFLWIIRWLIHRWPKEETLTWFEDYSVGARQNPESNRLLTSFVLSQLQNNRPLQMSELHMDIWPGANEPGFGGLRPAQDTTVISDFVLSDRPIKIGSVEFSPSDLLVYLRRLFIRPNREYLLGWLQVSDTDAIAVARLVDSKKKPKGQPERDPVWRAHVVGPQARERAIADLSAQIIVGMGKSSITTNWQSFRSFHAGIKWLHLDRLGILQPTDVAAARHSFEDALHYDASNWMARFQLALLLCNENEPRAALEHLAILESILERALKQTTAGRSSTEPISRDSELTGMRPRHAVSDVCSYERLAFQALVHHIRQYPECPFLVLYNKAIALSSLPSGEKTAEAITLLDQLSEVKDNPNGIPAFKQCAEQLTDRSYVELRLYSLSGKAHILASRATQCPALSQNGGLRDRAPWIKEILKKIEGLCFQRQEEHWGSLQTARAVALSAAARVLAEEGNVQCASKYLHEALAAESRFVEAYLQLAELYIREKEQLAPRWDLLAETQLTHAAEIYPSCPNAKLLRAILYCEPLVGKSEEAVCILQQLHNLPEANLLLAKNALANCKSDGQVLEPLEQFCRQIHLRAGFGEGAVRESDQLLSSSCLTLGQLSSQFGQLLELLRPILKENLQPMDEEKQLLEAIRQCRLPENTAAAAYPGIPIRIEQTRAS